MSVAETRRTFIVPLTDIDVPESWNARSGNWQDDTASDDEALSGFDGLCESIKASGGNMTPIELRKHPHRPGSKENPRGKLFLLVAGFRRYRALQKLGMLGALATVSEMDEATARVANIRENVRDSLKPADLAWAVLELRKLKVEDEKGARAVGLSVNYYTKIANTAKWLLPEILQNWRASQVDIPSALMLRLAGLQQSEQPAMWQHIQETNAWRGEGPSNPVKTAEERFNRSNRVKRVRALGQELAKLESIGAIKLNDSVDWKRLIVATLYPHSYFAHDKLVKEIEATYLEATKKETP